MGARIGFVALVAVLAAGCALIEEPIAGGFSCGPLEREADFGRTRDVPEADVEIFSRPGRYQPDEVQRVLEPLGLRPDADHVSRSSGPCGEHDLFVRIVDGSHCIGVVGGSWSDEVCREALGGETVLPLDLGAAEGSGVVVVVAPDVAHVLADSGGLVLAAFPLEGHAVLTSPEPIENLRTVTFDGIASTP